MPLVLEIKIVTRIPIIPKEIAPTIAIRGNVSSVRRIIAEAIVNRVRKNRNVFQPSFGNKGFFFFEAASPSIAPK